MIMLHSALLKVLQVFFDNFSSDVRSQDVISKPQTCDVAENTEIFQFTIAAFYQLQLAWMNKYVCVYSHRRIHKHHVHSVTWPRPDKSTGFYCFLSACHYFLVMTASLFPVSWRTERQKSATLAFRRISAPPCVSKIRSSVTECKSLQLPASLCTKNILLWWLTCTRIIPKAVQVFLSLYLRNCSVILSGHF